MVLNKKATALHEVRNIIGAAESLFILSKSIPPEGRIAKTLTPKEEKNKPVTKLTFEIPNISSAHKVTEQTRIPENNPNTATTIETIPLYLTRVMLRVQSPHPRQLRP